MLSWHWNFQTNVSYIQFYLLHSRISLQKHIDTINGIKKNHQLSRSCQFQLNTLDGPSRIWETTAPCVVQYQRLFHWNYLAGLRHILARALMPSPFLGNSKRWRQHAAVSVGHLTEHSHRHHALASMRPHLHSTISPPNEAVSSPNLFWHRF